MNRLMTFCKTLCKYIFLLAIGGTVYYGIEILWRGYSHISMFFVGGTAFILIGLINQRYEWEMCLTSQMVFAGLIITAVELIAGLVLNVWLELGVWDYSGERYNLMGQICLSYMYLWQCVSLAGILLDDFIRWVVFDEQKPRYTIFTNGGNLK